MEEFKGLILTYKREFIRQKADKKLAELDLYELLDKKEVDLSQVQAKVFEISRIGGELRYSLIEKWLKAKSILTEEQRNKLENLPCLSGKGMMGGEQTGGHMGGSTGGMMSAGSSEAQSGTSSGQTRSAQAAGVTVSITYLNISEQIPKDELAFKMKLDTHSVNLDQYNIQRMAFLRDDQGKDYAAKSWQPAEASEGHHISGILKFSNLDVGAKEIVKSDSKSLVIVLKELAGVKERLFKWELSS